MFSHIFSRSVQMFCADHRSVKITDGDMHPRNRIIFCMGHRGVKITDGDMYPRKHLMFCMGHQGVKIAQTSKPLPQSMSKRKGRITNLIPLQKVYDMRYRPYMQAHESGHSLEME